MSGEVGQSSARRSPAWWLLVLCGAALITILAAAAGPAWAASDPWTITQITNDRRQETGVVADGTWAAWVRERGAGGNAEIMVRDLSNGLTVALDAMGTNQRYSLGLSGDVLAWQISDGQSFKIFSHDLSDATTTMVADTGGSDAVPVLRDGLIAWSAWDGQDFEIYVYVVATRQTQQLTTNDYDDILPVISGRRVAWVGKISVPGSIIWPDGREGQVFIRDLSDASELQIGRGGLDEQEVAIEGARVLFSGFSGQSHNLFLYSIDDATTTRLTEDPAPEARFKLAGDYAVWLGKGSGQMWGLYLYSFLTKTKVKLSDAATVDAPPDCSGTMVAWQGWQDQDWEIFTYDIASAGISWLINLGGVNKAPVITGPRVLWVGNDGHDSEIFTALPTTISPTPQFSDVSGMAPYRSAILDLGGRGVIGGYADGTFRPGAQLWRAQFAKMIVGALDVTVDAGMVAPFADLGPDDATLYPHQYVASAYFAGIIKGTSANTFSPYTDVTRAQVVTMLVRAAESLQPGLLLQPPASEPGPLGPFDDVHAPNWRIAWYNGLLAGLIGYGPGSDPFAAATRAEVAQMLWNYVGLEE